MPLVQTCVCVWARGYGRQLMGAFVRSAVHIVFEVLGQRRVCSEVRRAG